MSIQATKIYFSPCERCPNDPEVSNIIGSSCRGHDPNELWIQPAPPMIAAPLTEARARELGKFEAEQLLRAAFGGDKDSYLGGWLDERIRDVAQVDLDQHCRAVVQEHREKDLHFSEDRVRELARAGRDEHWREMWMQITEPDIGSHSVLADLVNRIVRDSVLEHGSGLRERLGEFIQEKIQALKTTLAEKVAEECIDDFKEIAREEIRAHSAEAAAVAQDIAIAEKNSRIRDEALEDAAKMLLAGTGLHDAECQRSARVVRSLKSDAGVAQRQSNGVESDSTTPKDAGSSPAPSTTTPSDPERDPDPWRECERLRRALEASKFVAIEALKSRDSHRADTDDLRQRLSAESKLAHESRERMNAALADLARERLRSHKLEQSLQGARSTIDAVAAKVGVVRDGKVVGCNPREIFDLLKSFGCTNFKKSEGSPGVTNAQLLADREYAAAAISFALADSSWHADPSASMANVRDAARVRFKAAKTALVEARR